MNSIERLKIYFQNNSGPHAAVFDIGTRAARLLIGPKDVPTDNWGPRTFFNDGFLTNLGAEVNRFERILDVDSQVLNKLISWINSYKNFLSNYNIEFDDLICVGTAVFRWMENSNEIIKIIKNKTDIELKIIDDDQEAQLSIICLAHTCHFVRDNCPPPQIKNGDTLYLLDQGGGSLEVSCHVVGSQETILKSFDEFGTIALRNKFFTEGATGKVDPEYNRRQIKKQNERIIEYIDDRVSQWNGFENKSNGNIHIYSMGSAATDAVRKCYKTRNNYETHNKILTKETLLNIIEENCSLIQDSQQQVRTLYKSLNSIKSKKRKDQLDSLLVSLYGLPVYIKMIEKLGSKQMRISGYGLRYGAYIWTNHYQQPL
jgi:exopolyphosphatase/pppGpp-phosphohydrolase